MLYIVGDNGKQIINVKLNNEQTITAVNCMKLIVDGHDKEMQAELAKLPAVAKKCIDAVCWESEKTVEKFIELIENAGRFAVCHGELEFGISITRAAAMTAWKRGEF